MECYIPSMPGQFPGLRGRHAGVEVVPAAVRQARLDAGMSLAEVGAPGYTRAAVHMVETGKMRPSVRLLQQIARKTGRPVSYFLPDSEITPEHRAALDQLHHRVTTNEFADAIRQGEGMLTSQLPRAVEAEVRFLVGRAYVRRLDGASAQPHLVRARELTELGNDHVQLADVLLQMASALYLMDDPRTLSFAYQALDLSQRLNPVQPELTARAWIMIGAIYIRLQAWGRAITCYNRALESMGSALGIRELAMIHDQLSQSYQRVGRFGDALDHAQQAMRLYGSSLDPTDLFRAYHNLGETLLKQGELDAARTHLDRALAICEERGLQHQAQSYVLLSLAELHIECGELEQAMERIELAQGPAVERGERGHQATAWRLRGRVYLKLGENERADEAFANAVKLLTELELPADLLDVLAEHANGLAAQGRIGDALQVAQTAVASGQVAVRRIQAGWDDVVAADWGS